jgi:hypothetical protein
MCVKPVDEGDDRVQVVGAAVRGAHPVDAEHAVLVEAHVHDVHVPGGERVDHRVVAGAVEDSPALDAGVLGARVVDALEVDDVVVPVQKLVADHVQPA